MKLEDDLREEVKILHERLPPTCREIVSVHLAFLIELHLVIRSTCVHSLQNPV